MTEREDRSKVVILTKHYKITGEIALYPSSRLTDYVVESKAFIAVTDAQVTDHSGDPVLTATFLNVHRNHIEIIVPADQITTS